MDDSTTQLLNERGKTHGNYTDHARITQNLKRELEAEHGWSNLNDCQREALHMIVHKIGRIIAGNSHFRDHWDDIAGYARLVAERCHD